MVNKLGSGASFGIVGRPGGCAVDISNTAIQLLHKFAAQPLVVRVLAAPAVVGVIRPQLIRAAWDGLVSVARPLHDATSGAAFGKNVMPDTRFRTYLKAFFTDLLTGMSGPLSVPFAALALWVSNRGQKILFACLAVLCALFASYRVWNKERKDGAVQLANLTGQKDAEIATLDARVAELSRNPYSEELRLVVEHVLEVMSADGHRVLRHLMTHEPVEVGRMLVTDIPLDQQHAQLGIAMESGVVRHQTERHGSLMETFWIINPKFQKPLQDAIYRH